MTILQIQQAIAAHYEITIEKLVSRDRPEPLATIRRLAIYLCRVCAVEKCGQHPTFSELGAAFHRDFSTCKYACSSIEEQAKVEPAFRTEIAQWINQLIRQ